MIQRNFILRHVKEDDYAIHLIFVKYVLELDVADVEYEICAFDSEK